MANCCNFTTTKLTETVLDPHKRVRHFTGLVLGEQEFQQDQFYLMTRDELHQRALHGYGVVSGLRVTVEPDPDTGDPTVVVAAGMAVNPRGESICVDQAQCGDLNAWLQDNREALLGSPPLALPGNVTLYLVLCARDCATDAVPVLGDPCRTTEDQTEHSRYADDFELCLRIEPPQQIEEDAVRALGELLASIEVSDAGGGLTPDDFADLVRGLIPTGSPPEIGPVPPTAGSPPATLIIHPDDISAALEQGYRVWIQEVRPELNPETGACDIPRGPDDGRCVLLACLDVDFEEVSNQLVVDGDVDVDRTCGPILVQTRILQELLRHGIAGDAVSAPGLASPPSGGGGPIIAPTSHTALSDLGSDDHPQYLFVDSTDRSLVGDLDAGTNVITNLGEPASPTGFEAVRWDRAVKNGDTAGGDLTGTYPNPQVQNIQGNPVSPTVLGPGNTGDVMIWDGGSWVAVTGPFTIRPTRIIALSWQHGGQTLLRHTHDGAPAFGFVIAFGLDSGDQQEVLSTTLNNNALRVFVRLDPGGAPIAVPIYDTRELIPEAVLPVDAVLAGDRVDSTSTPADPAAANAVFFQITEAAANALAEEGVQAFIELTGDHVLDREGRAIDAEFPRAQVPSGDGPGRAPIGIQGGHFYSNVNVGQREIRIGGVDINTGGLGDLRGLPGIGNVLGRRILEERDRRGNFESIEDLSGIEGVTPALLAELRALLDT